MEPVLIFIIFLTCDPESKKTEHGLFYSYFDKRGETSIIDQASPTITHETEANTTFSLRSDFGSKAILNSWLATTTSVI